MIMPIEFETSLKTNIEVTRYFQICLTRIIYS